MSIIKELMALNEKKVADDQYFIMEPPNGPRGSKSMDLYTERAFPSADAANAWIEKQIRRVSSEVGEDAEDEEDLLRSCEVISGKSLKRDYPKLFEAVGSNAELDKLKAKAMKTSKEEGVVQHINKDKRTGNLYISDWYDDEETVCSYNKGKLSEAQGDKDDVKYTHATGCPYNMGHDCECGKKTKTHADHCGYAYGKDCTCGMSFNKDRGVKESAEYAAKLVRGEKSAPGILNKLGSWFEKSMRGAEYNKGRFIPAKEAMSQLAKAGFTGHQASLVRDAAADSGYTALERMKKKYPKEMKEFSSDNKHSFQVADLSFGIGDDIRNEFYELFQNLFDSKIKKMEKELALVKESAEYAAKLVRGEKSAPGILNKLDRWFSTAMIPTGKNRFLPAHIAMDQLKKAGFTPHQASLVRDAAAEAGYAALERMKKKYPEFVPDKYVSHMSTSFQVADLYLNVGEQIRDEFAELFQKLFDAKIKKMEKELTLVKEGFVLEARKIPSWFRDGAKVKLMPDYADKDPDEVFTLQSVDDETGKARIADEQGRGWNISYYQVYPKNKTPEIHESKIVKEDEGSLRSLGKDLKNKSSTKPADEPAQTDVNTPPASQDETPPEESKKPEIAGGADEPAAEPEFKIGSIVKPLAGPHKGELHVVTRVLPNGTLDIKPKDLDPESIKYTKNKGTEKADGVNAKPTQVVLAESVKFGSLFKKGSMILDVENVLQEVTKAKTLVELEIRKKEVLAKIERITESGEHLAQDDPLNIESMQLTRQIIAMKKQVREGRDDTMMPLSYRAKKGDKIEAFGRKGMKNTMWRKMFKSSEALQKWVEDNDATVEGSRELDDNEKVKQ